MTDWEARPVILNCVHTPTAHLGDIRHVVHRRWVFPDGNARGGVIYEGTREIHELLQAEYTFGMRGDAPLRRELPGWPFPDDV